MGIGEFGRVFSIPAFAGVIGQSLKRRALKYTGLAVLLGGAAVGADFFGEKIFGYELPINKLEAALIPVYAAVGCFGGGHALTILSRMLGADRRLVSDANNLSLVKHRRKADSEKHLKMLWENVFKYESELRNGHVIEEDNKRWERRRAVLERTVSEIPEDVMVSLGVGSKEEAALLIRHIEKFKPWSAGLEDNYERFAESGRYAVDNPLPQALQRDIVGFDMDLYESWLDESLEDTGKLGSQYLRNFDIVTARKAAGIPLGEKTLDFLGLTGDPLLRKLTISRMDAEIGALILKFNKRYPGGRNGFFDAQHFLWSHEGLDKQVYDTFGSKALGELHAARKNLFRKFFSSDKERAHQHVYGMFGQDFQRAFNLRMNYDLRFAAGKLDYTPEQEVSQIEQLACTVVYKPDGLSEQVDMAERNYNNFRRLMVDNLPSVLYPRDSVDRLMLGAAEVAYHTNYGGARKAVEKGKKAKALGKLNEAMQDYEKGMEVLSQTRTHYELTKLQLQEFTNWVDTMAGFD